jgi:hypothetical protein
LRRSDLPGGNHSAGHKESENVFTLLEIEQMAETKNDGNLKSGNAHDQANKKPAPEGSGAAAGAGGDRPHGNTMGGASEGASATLRLDPSKATQPAEDSGEGKAQPPMTDAGVQGHQGALTQNNQQAIAGGKAESRVGAVDPLEQRNLTQSAEGTKAVTVKSNNFWMAGQGAPLDGGAGEAGRRAPRGSSAEEVIEGRRQVNL